MKIKNHYIHLFFFAAGIIVYSGCSASSNSVRYNEKSEKKEKKSSVRFTSEDNKKNTSNTSLKPNDNLDGEDLPVEKNNVDISSLINKNNSSDDSEFSTIKEKMFMGPNPSHYT